jgi:hypothetical protein
LSVSATFGEHGADLVGVVAGALENLKLAVLIVGQRESLRRAHADFVFLEGFENGRCSAASFNTRRT